MQRQVTVYRSARRAISAADAEIVLPGRGLQYDGRIAYLSIEGCLIETKCGLEPGTMVEVWMRTEGLPLRVQASLVDRRATGVEFRFQALNDRKLDQIEILRGELASETERAERKQA